MINVAVIGLGRWGKNIVESVQGKSKHLRILRGVSKEPELVTDFAKAKGFELSTDFDEAIADPRVQAVCLATPHSLHLRQIQAVAALRKPVWCEKPLALTRAESKKAVDAVKKAGVVFALGNNKRCFASMRELKRVVAEGTIGEIMHVEGNFTNEHSTRVLGGWRDDPNESPGGGMTGAGMHIIDAFVNLAGRVSSVDGHVFHKKAPPDPRDAAAALLKFESGATGTLATVRAAPAYWRVMAFGTKGWAEARDETILTTALVGQPPETRTYPLVDSLGTLLESYGAAIETGSPFAVTTDDMIEVAGAFEAIMKSMDQGKPVMVEHD